MQGPWWVGFCLFVWVWELPSISNKRATGGDLEALVGQLSFNPDLHTTRNPSSFHCTIQTCVQSPSLSTFRSNHGPSTSGEQLRHVGDKQNCFRAGSFRLRQLIATLAPSDIRVLPRIYATAVQQPPKDADLSALEARESFST